MYNIRTHRRSWTYNPDVTSSRAVTQSKTLATSGSADNVYFKDDKYAKNKLPENAEAIK